MMFQLRKTTTHRTFRWLPPVLALVLLAGSVRVAAEMSSVDESANVGRNWVAQTVQIHGTWAGETNPQITGVHEIYDSAVLVARVYDVSPRGYVLVPTLRELPPVMMYSDESNWSDSDQFGPGQMIREVLKSRMDAFASVYGSVDAVQPAGDGLCDPAQKAARRKFEVAAKDFRVDVSQGALSHNGPLLTSNWSQGAPYNNNCPLGDGGRTVVGCVATSATQIMDYWEWPPRGVGSYGYLWNGDNSCGGSTAGAWLTADFSDDYDWPNIPDDCSGGCTTAQQNALAELCSEAGIALNMDYGVCGSGTSMDYSVFTKYFKYAPGIVQVNRTDYTQQGWFDIIVQEIDAGRPVWYGINSHAIVCDGYRDDYGQLEYHMNYGWGGSHTAWYVLDNLYCYWITDDVCPYDQDLMIYNIRPQLDPILSADGVEYMEAMGDGDSLLEAGEEAVVYAGIKNTGNDATNVMGTLSTTDPYVSVSLGSAPYLSPLRCGETRLPMTPYVVDIAPSCPDHWVATLRLDITADGGYHSTDSVYLFVGNTPGFSDNFDGADQSWSHRPQSVAYVDDWHKETYRAHSGASAWKEGGAGSADYRSMSDGALITPPFLLPPDAKLSFYDWMDAEFDVNSTAWDGAIVMISTTPGQWSQIYPDGGYPYSIIDNPASPFPGGTSCFSGIHDWQPEAFDLSAYSGVVQLMFRFGSDGYVTAEGWYVDDIMVCNTMPGSDVTVRMCDSLTATFTTVTGHGNTTACSGQIDPPLPGEYAAVPSGCFDVHTDASFNGPVQVTMKYDESALTGSEERLKLVHYDGSSWVNVTTSLDTDSNLITGTATTLSPFALVEPGGCCQGRVGDVNGVDGDEPTIGDISLLVDFLFITNSELPCVTEADVNRSGGDNPTPADITIGDISVLIDYLFISGALSPTNPGGVALSDCP